MCPHHSQSKVTLSELNFMIDENENLLYNIYRRDAGVSEVRVDGTAYFLIGGK